MLTLNPLIRYVIYSGREKKEKVTQERGKGRRDNTRTFAKSIWQRLFMYVRDLHMGPTCSLPPSAACWRHSVVSHLRGFPLIAPSLVPGNKRLSIRARMCDIPVLNVGRLDA